MHEEAHPERDKFFVIALKKNKSGYDKDIDGQTFLFKDWADRINLDPNFQHGRGGRVLRAYQRRALIDGLPFDGAVYGYLKEQRPVVIHNSELANSLGVH
jgi:hypothetical protein